MNASVPPPSSSKPRDSSSVEVPPVPTRPDLLTPRERLDALVATKDELLGSLRAELELRWPSRRETPQDVWDHLETALSDVLFANYRTGRSQIHEHEGLSSDRDTPAQLATTIRWFPNVLSRRRNGRVPIAAQAQTKYGFSNPKAAVFVPLLARLGVELGRFSEDERGGLLCGNNANVIRDVALTHHYPPDRDFCDAVFLQVLRELRAMGLFRRADVRTFSLARGCCEPQFSLRRFRYLAAWDPTLLESPAVNGFFLVESTPPYAEWDRFCCLLETGMNRWPVELGGVFYRRMRENTPTKMVTAYLVATWIFGKDRVEGLLHRLLLLRDEAHDDDRWLRSLVFAASHDGVALDAVYFLLRRAPSLVPKDAPRNDDCD